MFLQISIGLIIVYLFVVLGACSPIRCRVALAFVGLICIGLSFASARGLASILGFESTGIHNIMPFLLIGVGADDMFVLT